MTTRRNTPATRAFAIGQQVQFKTWIKSPSEDRQLFVVLAHLPPVEGTVQYRLRAETEAFERVAREDALAEVPAQVQACVPAAGHYDG